MIDYNKTEIKEALTIENIFELLVDWGAEPLYTDFGILCSTICHNPPGVGSKKLYYYTNSGLFKCYTGCDAYFDILELLIKVANIQWGQVYDLNDAVRWIAQRFGLSGTYKIEETDKLEDWKYFNNYERIQEIEIQNNNHIILKEYPTDILDRMNYQVLIEPWLKEGISQDVIDWADIGYYPGGNQITIPHYDKDGRFIGLRGRTLSKEDAERYG